MAECHSLQWLLPATCFPLCVSEPAFLHETWESSLAIPLSGGCTATFFELQQNCLAHAVSPVQYLCVQEVISLVHSQGSGSFAESSSGDAITLI